MSYTKESVDEALKFLLSAGLIEKFTENGVEYYRLTEFGQEQADEAHRKLVDAVQLVVKHGGMVAIEGDDGQLDVYGEPEIMEKIFPEEEEGDGQ